MNRWYGRRNGETEAHELARAYLDSPPAQLAVVDAA